MIRLDFLDGIRAGTIFSAPTVRDNYHVGLQRVNASYASFIIGGISDDLYIFILLGKKDQSFSRQQLRADDK